MPRRSGGCVVCKRRKVKCDEEKPTCNRCAQQGYACEGYAEHTPTRRRSPTFRDQTRQVAARAEASYARGPVPVRTPQLPKNLHLIEEDKFPTPLMCPSPRLNYLPSVSVMDTSRERRMQLLNNFIYNFLPHSYNNTIPPSHYSYMYVLPDILGQHPAIPSAVDALCLYSAGKTLGDEDIVAKSKTIYGAALSRLARNLERTHYFAPTGTMAAIILLAWCELNRGTSSNPDAWENHLVGATSLLESFDPEVWDTNQGRLLIQAVRYMLTCTGILKRKSVIFTRPQWARLMDVGSDGDGNEWMSLMNESAKIPALLEETDVLFSSQDANPSEIQELADRSFELRARMLEWYDRLLSTSEPDTAKLVSIDSLEWWHATPYDSAFPFVYYFSCCKHCYVRLQFWFFMLALSKNLLALYDSGFAAWPGSKFGYPSRQAIEEEVINYAVDAACCVPTAFDPVTPPVSRFNAALLIKACGETFHEYGLVEKYHWCQTMSDRLESKSFSTPKIMQLSRRDG